MLRPLHPLILSVPGLATHSGYLPAPGHIPAGHMSRFRMDGSLPADLAVSVSEYTIQREDGDLERRDDLKTPQVNEAIEKRLDEKSLLACAANETLEAYLSGEALLSPAIPDAMVTMEWHLPSVMTWECRRANMTALRPGIGNFPDGGPARNALPFEGNPRDAVQVFVLYPGTSRHSQMHIRKVIDAEIALWARAVKHKTPIAPACWAEIPSGD